MVPYDVQLFGGTVLHEGKIAEMATGEGKTLVATMPLYLNALPGRGVHLITHNNYLAKRDAMWMGGVFSFLGLSVGVIQDQRQTGGAEAYLLAGARIPPGGLRLATGHALRGLPGRHRLRHQGPSRLRLPLRQHGHPPRAHGAAGVQLRHRRRGRLQPDRRRPHAADHLGPGARGDEPLRRVQAHGGEAAAGADEPRQQAGGRGREEPQGGRGRVRGGHRPAARRARRPEEPAPHEAAAGGGREASDQPRRGRLHARQAHDRDRRRAVLRGRREGPHHRPDGQGARLAVAGRAGPVRAARRERGDRPHPQGRIAGRGRAAHGRGRGLPRPSAAHRGGAQHQPADARLHPLRARRPSTW